MGVFLTIVLSRDKFKNTHMAPLHQVHKLERLYVIQIGKSYWDLETCRKS